jgi:hypothetical protein
MQLETIRDEIERMRAQVGRQRKEILQLQRAGIPTGSAEALLQRMLDRIDGLCIERDRLKKETPPVNRRNPEQCMVLDSGSAPKKARPGMTMSKNKHRRHTEP